MKAFKYSGHGEYKPERETLETVLINPWGGCSRFAGSDLLWHWSPLSCSLLITSQKLLRICWLRFALSLESTESEEGFHHGETDIYFALNLEYPRLTQHPTQVQSALNYKKTSIACFLRCESVELLCAWLPCTS